MPLAQTVLGLSQSYGKLSRQSGKVIEDIVGMMAPRSTRVSETQGCFYFSKRHTRLYLMYVNAGGGVAYLDCFNCFKRSASDSHLEINDSI
jgi:hypothetical protein